MGGQSGDGETAAEMSDAQKQLNEAMQQMTPEQRAMMEKMGLGNMQQMMGGKAPPKTDKDE
jgi:hypothetical protein